MAISPFKVFIAGEILTASDLNSSLSHITNNGEDLSFPATKAKDFDGQKLILDADGDTSITADTDDRIDFEVAGADAFRLLRSSSHGVAQLYSMVDDAVEGPFYDLYRQRTNVANSDDLGGLRFWGRNSVGADALYGSIIARIISSTSGAEDGSVRVRLIAGGATTVATTFLKTGVVIHLGGLSIGTGVSSGTLMLDILGTANTDIGQLKASHASFSNDVLQLDTTRTANTAFDFLEARSGVDGTPDAKFRLRGDGTGLCDVAWSTAGADYAEMFEWEDGNPDGEERTGLTVELVEGGKVRLAAEGSCPIGVVTATAGFVGDAEGMGWQGRWLKDDFGRRYGPNPAYDPERPYASRDERREWAKIALIGKVYVDRLAPTNPLWIKLYDVSEFSARYLIGVAHVKPQSS
jgi:hypothetical protein